MRPVYGADDYRREVPREGPKSPYRSEFRRDYARLIHSAAFRRLAGKTQLFPGIESDFFRNRLTHSLEVAQIAKSIATKLNYEHRKVLRTSPIDTDLVEFCALAHDLGHPPFGHNGEMALDNCMRRYGGFEGNAQTLRILARVEKKVTLDRTHCGITPRGKDLRFGLNLTMRSLAAVLKYDRPIPAVRSRAEYRGVRKGYYESERKLVRLIKRSVRGPGPIEDKFKTLECQIMDIADDIAYSTYDLEDAFQAGFLSPFDLTFAKEELLDAVIDEVHARTKIRTNRAELRAILSDVFYRELDERGFNAVMKTVDRKLGFQTFLQMVRTRHQASRATRNVGYLRTEFTSRVVDWMLDGIRFKPNASMLALSTVELIEPQARYVEVLKRFAYISLIKSARLRVAEFRGQEIVTDIFEKLTSDRGHELLPDDYRKWYDRSRTTAQRMRHVCDFIAGMTDRYAVEFYSRLHSETPQTIFKPI